MSADGALGRRWRWCPSSGSFSATAPGGHVDIIDSWLVAGGEVRFLKAHFDRFATSCAALFGVPRSHTAAFLRAAMRLVPRDGRWFPRAELAVLDDAPEFHLWLRPAPPRDETVSVWVYDGADQRRHPLVKGPDLDWLTRIRSAAQRRGADEGVLLSSDGRLIEGTTTSLLWWHDGTLCAPDQRRLQLLPSVTRDAVLRLATASATPVTYACPRPQDLDGLEAWTVNALHGIRPVREWVGTGMTPGPPSRARTWQARLEATASGRSRNRPIGEHRFLRSELS